MIFMKILKYSPNKKHRISIVFDNMIAVMLSNKKSSPIFTELFIRGAKINVSLSFITQTCFAVPKKYLTKFYIKHCTMILTDIILIYDVNIISININMTLICDIMTTMRKQATFIYSLSEKDFEKQIKTIENQ